MSLSLAASAFCLVLYCWATCQLEKRGGGGERRRTAASSSSSSCLTFLGACAEEHGQRTSPVTGCAKRAYLERLGLALQKADGSVSEVVHGLREGACTRRALAQAREGCGDPSI